MLLSPNNLWHVDIPEDAAAFLSNENMEEMLPREAPLASGESSSSFECLGVESRDESHSIEDSEDNSFQVRKASPTTMQRPQPSASPNCDRSTSRYHRTSSHLTSLVDTYPRRFFTAIDLRQQPRPSTNNLMPHAITPEERPDLIGRPDAIMPSQPPNTPTGHIPITQAPTRLTRPRHTPLVNGFAANPRALEMHAIGEYSGNTIIYTGQNAIQVVIISPPRRSDQGRYHRVFMCDRNATLQASMEFACEQWMIPMREVHWTVPKHDPIAFNRVFPHDIVQEVLEVGEVSLEITIEIPSHPISRIYDLMDRAEQNGRTAVGAYRAVVPGSNDSLLLLVVYFQQVIEAQLGLDPRETLESVGRAICEHYGRDMTRCKWFRAEHELDNGTPLANLQLRPNHSVRLYECDPGCYEFFV